MNTSRSRVWYFHIVNISGFLFSGLHNLRVQDRQNDLLEKLCVHSNASVFD